MIIDLKDRKVTFDNDTFIAPTATVIGSVTLQKGASVWFGAVLRGDCDEITIGENSNIQDGSVLHTDVGQPLVIEQGVTIGHNATVHGCHVGEYSLIGINSVILNGAKIGKHCLIGSNALVTENTIIPEGSLVVGAPAKVKRPLTNDEIEMLKHSASHYAENGRRYSREMTIRSESESK